MYLITCLYTYMSVTTINEKRGHEFETAMRGIWEGLEGVKEKVNGLIIM